MQQFHLCLIADKSQLSATHDVKIKSYS